MATFNIDVQGQNRARRTLLDARQQIQDINTQLTQNAAAFRRADEAQRKKLRSDRESLTLSRRRIRDGAAQIRIYQAEAREVERLAREKAKLNRVSNFLSSSLRDLRFHITGMITSEVLFGLQSFVSGIIQIGSETETARATLRQFTNDVDYTFNRLETISQQLIGIDLPDIIGTFTQLRAAGAESADAEQIIIGFTRSLSELGKTRFEIQRFFGQLRQSFAANKIEGDDFKTLIEIFPNIIERSNQVLGTNISHWKDLQSAIESNNLTVREFYTLLGRQQALSSAGADTNTFRAQVELLREEFQSLQRDLADKFLPVLTRIARGFRRIHFDAQDSIQGIRIALPLLSEDTSRQIGLNQVRRDITEVNKEIQQFETRVGTSLSNFVQNSRDASNALRSERSALQRDRESGLGLTIQERQRIEEINQAISSQILDRREAVRLQGELTKLTGEQKRLEALTESGPTATGDFGLSAPFGTFRPQDTVGPLGLSQPDQRFGGLGRRPTFVRPLQDIGPQGVSPLQAPLLGSAGERPFIRPSSPITAPIPDLSGVLANTPFDVGTFDRTTIHPRGSGGAFSAVPIITETLDLLEEQFTRQQRIQRDILNGRRQFARDAEDQVRREQQIVQSIIQSGLNVGTRALQSPQDLFDISRSGADQRTAAIERATAQIQELNRNELISEQQRADRILVIRQDLAEKTAQIERETAQRRSDYYAQFAQSAINELNKVIQREVVLRLVRDLSSLLPGGLGTGALALISGGLTIAGAGLAASRSGSSQSQARQAQERFDNADRSSQNVYVTMYDDDGRIVRQEASGRRINNEGRSAR